MDRIIASATSSIYRDINNRDNMLFKKTALITYKTLKTGRSHQFIYMTCFIIINQLILLRSSSQLLHYQPATRISFQSKAFSITAPAVWNSLSPVMKSCTTITTFKTHLNAELFSAAYDSV